MMSRIILPSLFLIFLSGCYQSSLTSMINVAGPAAGATQGRVVSSGISSGFSYGVKHKTGKYPIEHVLKRKKDKVVNKVVLLRDEAKNKSLIIKDKVVKSSEKIISKKDSFKENSKDKLRWVLNIKEIKKVPQDEVFAANKPRYSYWSKRK